MEWEKKDYRKVENTPTPKKFGFKIRFAWTYNISNVFLCSHVEYISIYILQHASHKRLHPLLSNTRARLERGGRLRILLRVRQLTLINNLPQVSTSLNRLGL